MVLEAEQAEARVAQLRVVLISTLVLWMFGAFHPQLNTIDGSYVDYPLLAPMRLRGDIWSRYFASDTISSQASSVNPSSKACIRR